MFQSSLSYNQAHKSVQISLPQDFAEYFDQFSFPYILFVWFW